MLLNFRVVAAVLASVCLASCSGTPDELVDRRELTARAYSDGLAAFESRDHTVAAKRLTEAIELGEFNADSYSNAELHRSLSYAALGEFDKAHAGLDKLEKGAPIVDQILAARSAVFKKQGNSSEARAAMSKAKRINRRVQEFAL